MQPWCIANAVWVEIATIPDSVRDIEGTMKEALEFGCELRYVFFL